MSLTPALVSHLKRSHPMSSLDGPEPKKYKVVLNINYMREEGDAVVRLFTLSLARTSKYSSSRDLFTEGKIREGVDFYLADPDTAFGVCLYYIMVCDDALSLSIFIEWIRRQYADYFLRERSLYAMFYPILTVKNDLNEINMTDTIARDVIYKTYEHLNNRVTFYCYSRDLSKGLKSDLEYLFWRDTSQVLIPTWGVNELKDKKGVLRVMRELATILLCPTLLVNFKTCFIPYLYNCFIENRFSWKLIYINCLKTSYQSASKTEVAISYVDRYRTMDRLYCRQIHNYIELYICHPNNMLHFKKEVPIKPILTSFSELLGLFL